MSASPLFLTVSGPRLFFVADEGVHGRELWSVKQAAFKNRQATSVWRLTC
ncbi:hypothetical protein [Archangium sp.]|nr:hypothetical protein [Archangium sp.]